MAGGLAKVREICQGRDKRARELKSQGKKVVGYFCCYPALEIMTAADIVPYRIMGDPGEPITEADAYIETVVCPYLRSCFDLAIKGKYDFLDGVVVPHTCDGVERLFDIWKYYLKQLTYSHYLYSPHTARPTSVEFFKGELDYFRKCIEEFGGSQVSEPRLRRAIELHNENRALIRGLYELRKLDPPLLSGSEMTQIIMASTSIPVEESSELLRSVSEEARVRKNGPAKKPARLLIYGAVIDNPAFIELVEESGASVVMDDMCLGTRSYWHEVEMTGDPLDGIATRYLEKINCPRTYREGKSGERFKYLLDYVTDFNVNGAILYILRFCDTHELDAPDVRDYLRGIGVPVIHIEHDYSLATMAPLKTRIQAFLEMVGG